VITADHRSEGRPGYDRDLAALLQANYREAARAAGNLRVSLRRTQTLFPIAAQTLESLDEEAKERIDAFRVRFADLQDLLAGKLFRGLLRLEEEPALSQLDVIHAMEKRAIVPSFDDWKQLRVIRNAFMHEYPEEAAERAEALNLAQTGAIGLIETLARLRAYAVGHIGLPPDTLPLV